MPQSVANTLAAMFGKFFGANGQPKMPPKFCRKRGCNGLYGHEGRHIGKHREPVLVTVPPRRQATYGQFSYWTGPRKSPKAAQVPGSRQRMAEYRSARKTPRKLAHS